MLLEDHNSDSDGFDHSFEWRGGYCTIVRHLYDLSVTCALCLAFVGNPSMSAAPRARVTGLYRYPVKGLSAEPLQSIEIGEHETLPLDRLYALTNGDIPFDPDAPAHLPKIRFLMLMKQEALARLEASFDATTHTLTIGENGHELVSGSLREDPGKTAIETFFSERFADQLRGAVKVVTAKGHAFTDVPEKFISLINLESLRDLETRTGLPIDPLRFRANIYVDGIPAWSEFDLLGRDLVGPRAEFKVVGRIDRCAAIEVDPATGARDIKMTRKLMDFYGHIDCGVYLDAETAGQISIDNHLLVG